MNDHDDDDAGDVDDDGDDDDAGDGVSIRMPAVVMEL